MQPAESQHIDNVTQTTSGLIGSTSEAQKSWASFRNAMQQGSPRGGGKKGPQTSCNEGFFCPSRWLLTSHRRAEEERLAQCLQHCSYHLWRSENRVTDFLSRERERISDTGSNTVHTQKCKTRKEIIQMLRFKYWREASTPSPAQTELSWIAGQLSRSRRMP